MAENESNLFRKSSLERISSPDQLNEYVKVTNPSLIVILVSVFTVLAAGMVWIFSGVIQKTVSLTGVVASDLSGSEGVYCFVPLATSKRISPGMEVRISPDYADHEQYGYIKGTVRSVGSKVLTDEYLSSNFAEPQLFVPLISSSEANGNLVEIKLSMDGWSNKEGEKLNVTEGTVCEVTVVVGGTKPYELIFNK